MIYKLLFILNSEYNLMNTSLRPPNTASHLFCLSLSPSVFKSLHCSRLSGQHSVTDLCSQPFHILRQCLTKLPRLA